MKCTKAAVHRKFYALPPLQFEDQKLTSFAGIVLWQSLFQKHTGKYITSRAHRRNVASGRNHPRNTDETARNSSHPTLQMRLCFSNAFGVKALGEFRRQFVG